MLREVGHYQDGWKRNSGIGVWIVFEYVAWSHRMIASEQAAGFCHQAQIYQAIYQGLCDCFLPLHLLKKLFYFLLNDYHLRSYLIF
jgi:hypothetical protein